METWIQFSALVSLFSANIGMFLWNIKRMDAIRRDITKLHENDMHHIEQEVRALRKTIEDVLIRRFLVPPPAPSP